MVNRNEPQDYDRRIERYDTVDTDYLVTQNYSLSKDDIRYIVKQQEYNNQRELIGYKFPHNATIKDYTMSNGGQPIRSVIVTTWRSGSTFLGDVLNSIPGNFYHYEPLLDFGIRQVRDPPLSNIALSNLKNLLNCNYTDLDDYLKYGKSHIYLFTHNFRLWNQCETYPYYCWNSTFLSEFCKVFPFQSMKTVRLRLHLAEELLKIQRYSKLMLTYLSNNVNFIFFVASMYACYFWYAIHAVPYNRGSTENGAPVNLIAINPTLYATT